MLVDAGFGKCFLVLDKREAGWLYCLLMELITNTGGDMELYTGDVEVSKRIASIIEKGDASGTIVPRTGANGQWLGEARRARMG